jgi:hypothetical protein
MMMLAIRMALSFIPVPISVPLDSYHGPGSNVKPRTVRGLLVTASADDA